MSRNTRGPTLSSNKVLTLVRKEVHTQRTALVLAVAVMAAAFPMLPLFWPASGDASAEVVTLEGATPRLEVATPRLEVATPYLEVATPYNEAPVASPRPSFVSGTADDDDDAPRTLSMMLVGTLLIGIGSAVRRAA